MGFFGDCSVGWSWPGCAASAEVSLKARLMLLALALWLRRLARHRDLRARAWQRLSLKLERLGAPTRAINEGPLSYALRVAVARPALADEIRRLAGIYALGRYGDGSERHEFERSIQRLR